MAATEILVRVEKVTVLDKKSYGEWSFNSSLTRSPSGKKEQFGDPAKVFEALYNKIITLDNWSLEVKIDPADKQLQVEMSGMDAAGFASRDLGKVSVTLNTPILHGYDLSLRSTTGLFQAKVLVTITKGTAKEPGGITTISSPQGGTTYNTIFDGMQLRLVHICPVIPVPWATGIPPYPVAVSSLEGTDPEALHIAAGETKPNALVNPALIPVIGPSDPEFSDLCARIHITHYRPKNLDLKKLIWKATTGNIRFFDGGGGKTEVKGVNAREVKAYGVLNGKDDELGTIEVRWDEPGQPLLAVFRAWVGLVKELYYRANIIKCKTANIGGVAVQNPTVDPAKIQDRFDYNSVLMWQSGIRLIPDPDATCYNGAVKKETGIFEVSIDANQTFNMNPSASDGNYYPTILNQREGVLNICYIHSHSGNNPSGLARDRMLSAASKTETQDGSPSTSWVRPTGVYPDGDGISVEMMTMGPSTRRADGQKPLAGDQNLDKVCGLAIADWAAKIANANTEAHEAGHVIGLHHRGSGGYDAAAGMKPSVDKVNHAAGPNSGKGHPWDENIMSYSAYDRAQDFDLIQTKVIRRHPLLKTVAPKPPVVPPKGKQPVPAPGLPNTAEKILLQEYLTWKKKGLKCGPYELGKSGPDKDGVDGVVGPVTKGAVKKFQRDHGGLATDGVYGPKTAAAFDKEING
ncbi:MAG: peptidoglycan-binding protein [bacterium]|jgi:hypothetical protein